MTFTAIPGLVSGEAMAGPGAGGELSTVADTVYMLMSFCIALHSGIVRGSLDMEQMN